MKPLKDIWADIQARKSSVNSLNHLPEKDRAKAVFLTEYGFAPGIPAKKGPGFLKAEKMQQNSDTPYQYLNDAEVQASIIFHVYTEGNPFDSREIWNKGLYQYEIEDQMKPYEERIQTYMEYLYAILDHPTDELNARNLHLRDDFPWKREMKEVRIPGGTPIMDHLRAFIGKVMENESQRLNNKDIQVVIESIVQRFRAFLEKVEEEEKRDYILNELSADETKDDFRGDMSATLEANIDQETDQFLHDNPSPEEPDEFPGIQKMVSTKIQKLDRNVALKLADFSREQYSVHLQRLKKSKPSFSDTPIAVQGLSSNLVPLIKGQLKELIQEEVHTIQIELNHALDTKNAELLPIRNRYLRELNWYLDELERFLLRNINVTQSLEEVLQRLGGSTHSICVHCQSTLRDDLNDGVDRWREDMILSQESADKAAILTRIQAIQKERNELIHGTVGANWKGKLWNGGRAAKLEAERQRLLKLLNQ